MPIDYSKYPPDWRAISLRIRERAGNKCEACGAPNGVYIVRSTEDPERWAMDDPSTGGCLTMDGELYKWSEAPEEFAAQTKMVKVVLTVAHLDHNPANNDETNLRAWCQLHHLRYDAQHHATNARVTNSKKRVQAAKERGQSVMFEE